VACAFTIILTNLPIIVYLSCFQGQVLNPDKKFIVTQMGHVLNCIYCSSQTGIFKLSHSNCALTKNNIFCSLHNFILQYNMTIFYTTKLTDKEIRSGLYIHHYFFKFADYCLFELFPRTSAQSGHKVYCDTLTDKEIRKINKYIKTNITVGNCHIWNGQQLKGYGIFEFRFRKHKIKLRVHRLIKLCSEQKILFLVNAQLLWESLKMPVWLNCNENEKNKHIK
jgi:hypothetical protein